MNDAAMDLRPYKGRHSFADTREDALLFFGRENEARELADIVASERLSVLYARSGLGKTSLINARLMEELRSCGYFPAVARLTTDTDPFRSFYACIEAEAARQGVTVESGSRNSLWEYFWDSRFRRNDVFLRPVLILDQFEELFTIVRENSEPNFEAFVGELADLIRGRMPAEVQAMARATLDMTPEDAPNRKALVRQAYGDAAPDAKVLLSFREDFLPEMEALQGRLPGIFRNVVRLLPLSRDGAQAAITQPALAGDVLGEGNTFTIEPDALKELLDFLSTQLKGKRTIAGETIEPTHLQLLCDELDSRRRKKPEGERRTITTADLGGSKGMTRILETYYDAVVRKFPRVAFGRDARGWRLTTSNLLVAHFPRSAIRRLCQNGLVTASRRRNILTGDDIRRYYGVQDDVLTRLVRDRLLRCEPRAGGEFYELAHDSLVAPIVSARGRSRFWFWVRAGAVVALPLFLLPAGALAWRTWDAYQEEKRVQGEEQARAAELARRLVAVQQRGGDAKARSDALMQLVRSNAALSALDLREIRFDGLAQGTDFSRANLSSARFDGSVLQDVKFQGADMTDASFVASRLFDVDMSDAVLSSVDFRGATFRGTKFEGVDLADASFAETLMEGVNMAGARAEKADFRASDWWLANGWTSAQVRDLEARFPHADFVRSSPYRETMAARARLVGRAEGSLSLALGLNDSAWYRAIRGAELMAAQEDAGKSVTILMRAASADSDATGNALDTLAYILLQLGNAKGACETYAKVKWEPKRPAGDNYRYGIALLRCGQKELAQRHLDEAFRQRYRPTHELLLLGPMPETFGKVDLLPR
jgi:hypothetical protein